MMGMDKELWVQKKNFVEIELTCVADAKPAKAQVVIKANSTYRGTKWARASTPVSVEVLSK